MNGLTFKTFELSSFYKILFICNSSFQYIRSFRIILIPRIMNPCVTFYTEFSMRNVCMHIRCVLPTLCVLIVMVSHEIRRHWKHANISNQLNQMNTFTLLQTYFVCSLICLQFIADFNRDVICHIAKHRKP